MPAPCARLKKQEIIYLATHRCRHGHTYVEHWPCYLRENPNRKKIGFIDIESSNLSPEFGFCLAYCIKSYGDSEILYRAINRKEIMGKELDKNVLRSCFENMRKFDILVGFYSGDYRFDIPYLRTRAMILKLDFPQYGTILFRDAYSIVKKKFRLTSNRLVNATRVITGHTEKTWTNSVTWLRAQQGDAKAIAYILDHCKKDVKDLERLFVTIDPYDRGTLTSI